MLLLDITDGGREARMTQHLRGGRFEGEHLRTARRKAGLSQAALARRIGVKRNNVTRWEGQAVTPRLSTLLALAEALHVQPSVLLTLEPERTLRRLRLAAGLTQRELGQAAGIPRSSVSALERGLMTKPDVALQQRLAQALGVTTTAIATGLRHSQN